MKIESIKNFYPISYKGINKKDSIPTKLSSEQDIKSSLDSSSTIGQAQVLLQKPKSIEEKLLQKIKRDEDIAHLFLQKDKNQVTYLFCKKEDLNEPLAYANFFYDENDKIDEIYVFDINSENLTRYDNEGNYITQYTPEHLRGISAYKFNSGYFHARLRDGKKFDDNEFLDSLNKTFADKYKLHKAPKDMIMYRTAHLSPKQMGKKGDIYEEPSFLSATTSETVANSFHYDKSKAFLTITVPEGKTFLNVDKLFNLKNRRSREEEILFDKGSKFLITNTNGSNVHLTLIQED